MLQALHANIIEEGELSVDAEDHSEKEKNASIDGHRGLLISSPGAEIGDSYLGKFHSLSKNLTGGFFLKVDPIENVDKNACSPVNVSAGKTTYKLKSHVRKKRDCK